MNFDFEKMEQLAKKAMSEKRFHHTKCVVKQAKKLARIHGCDENKAMAAAWMHDICKEQTTKEQLQWLTKFGIILDSVQLSQPKTWHGMAACGFMRFELGIDDPEVLEAVRYHTTGFGKMNTLDEVVYLADLTSEERDYPEVEQMRALAETALIPAMRAAMVYAMGDLVARGKAISFDSVEAYNHYITLDCGEK